MWANVPSWLITAFFGLLGVAVGWGYFKSEIKNLKEITVKTDDKIERTDNKLDALILTTALKIDCQKYRDDCQGKMADSLTEIKVGIDINRAIVLEKFNEIKEFMGYVKAKMENYNNK